MQGERALAEIWGRIAQGAPRHRASDQYQKLRREIDQSFPGQEGRLLHVYLDDVFNRSPIDKRISDYRRMVKIQLAPLARVSALVSLARLTYGRESWSKNQTYRRRALGIARRRLSVQRQALILNNWLFAATHERDAKVGRHLATQLDKLMSQAPSEFRTPLQARQTVAYYFRNLGRLTLLETVQKGSQVERQTSESRTWYRRALSRVRRADHLRVNFTIDWAEQLILANTDQLSTLKEAELRLLQAHRGLDTHQCKLCLAYYDQVMANLLLVQGDAAFNASRPTALSLWKDARTHARKSEALYRPLGHQLYSRAAHLESEAARRIMREAMPRQIYLAFKESDKAFVARIAEALSQLGLEPWFYEKAMAVHLPTKLAMFQGMEKAAMCVFFVTPNFEDTGGISYEIDLALRRRARVRGFIILVIKVKLDSSAPAKSVVVPKRLRGQTRYVHASDSLQCIQEILARMPLQLGTPFLKHPLKKRKA